MCPVPKATPPPLVPSSESQPQDLSDTAATQVVAAAAATGPASSGDGAIDEAVRLPVAPTATAATVDPPVLTPAALLARITDKILNLGLGPDCFSEPLSRFEETKVHHLVSIATDWTLMMDRRLAANCRNISDEVFPGIHLGDRYCAKPLLGAQIFF